jgi:hypothetical protein
MHHLALKPTLFFLLTLLLSSCAPQATPSPVLSNADELPPLLEPVPTLAPVLPAQKPTRGDGREQDQKGQGSNVSQSMNFDIPAHPYSAILGRPTASSVTLSLLSATAQSLNITYGAEGSVPQSISVFLQSDIPQEVVLDNLAPYTSYYYSINHGEQRGFHTARPAGSAFTFTIQADSHLDSNTSAEVYLQTLANQRAGHPDFVIDMGDTFMTDKYKPYTDATPQYLAQHYFFGQLADTAPLFLVLGNHDGEGAPRGNASEEMSAWSAQMRTRYFANPVPNDFYTGNTSLHPIVGDLQDYYAWEWGDALFIILDPYWFTPPTKGNTAGLWDPTLGEQQYHWLKSTLETSDAKWKFVFIHQLIGGLDKDGRGGVEVAPFHEWGGLNPDGSYGFDENRPGWDMPIHQLLLTNQVNAVFHGHDHLFVHQELDGIIYQEIPQPGSARADSTDSAADYGYTSGTILGGPGHLCVTVTPEQVIVDYVRSYLPQDEKPGQKNGQVDYSYAIHP